MEDGVQACRSQTYQLLRMALRVHGTITVTISIHSDRSTPHLAGVLGSSSLCSAHVCSWVLLTLLQLEMKMLLDGRFLYQEFNAQMMGQPFSGIGIDGYDNITKKYVTAWIDTMGTGIFMMEGTANADGKTITLKGSHPEPGGGKMTHRAVWKIADSNTQTFDMYGTHHHGKEMKMMEITYTRKP